MALALAGLVLVGGCGGSNRRFSASPPHTVTILFAVPPDSLDPGVGYTSEAIEPDQIAYVPLLTYAHRSGAAGGKLIPGLATSLPRISSNGKIYTLTLRSRLRFSNGAPVRVNDFTYALERALKIPWKGDALITRNVVGAAAYADGRAKTITGIRTDSSRRQITIKLLAPYGAFSNVLAYPSLAPVPIGTPFRDLGNSPPPGVGPYKIVDVAPGVSYSVVRNQRWRPIPGIPSGTLKQINIRITADSDANGLAVLHNSADVFDFADRMSPSVLAQVERVARSRFSKVVFPSTHYFFLNTRIPPFSSQLAREAVVVGLDRGVLARLGSGFFEVGCYLLPPPTIGHPTNPCPYGDPSTPNLAKAKALVRRAGMAGTPITVWGEASFPQRQFVDYYTGLLNRIGFKAREKILADALYFPVIGATKANPQTGVADWNQDFPSPIDFYATLMAGDAILPTNNQNLGQTDDPIINARVNSGGSLYAAPSTNLSAYARQWQQLDQYTAQKAYAAVFGYASFAKFTSSRIDYNAAVLHQVFGWDWLTLRLK